MMDLVSFHPWYSWVFFGLFTSFLLFKLLYRKKTPSPKVFWKGKSVILTGASDGIGAALALELSKLGAKIVITARRFNELNNTAELCRKENAQVIAIQADVGEKEACKNIVEKTVAAFGGIDVVILNAALSPFPALFEVISDPDPIFMQVMQVNYMQSVYFTKFALPYLKKSHGTIVGVSSMSAIVGAKGVTGYAASKGALQAFFHSLALEIGHLVHIVVMPVGIVNTKKGNENYRPKQGMRNLGISPELCAKQMCAKIPERKFMTYPQLDMWISAKLAALFPDLMDRVNIYFTQQFFEPVEGEEEQKKNM